MLRAALLLARQAKHSQRLAPSARWANQDPGATALLAIRHPEDACSFQRPFAANAAQPAEQRVQLPTQVYGLAGKYAAALYIAGHKAKQLDQIEGELIEVWNTAAKSDDFRKFLKDPSIRKTEKADTIDQVLQSLKVGELTRRFFGVLAENNRLSDFVRISNSFDDLLSAARGEVVATITTAVELGRKEVDELKSGLTQVLDKGQKLIVHQQVNPAIIGGIIIDVGDKHIDLSIQSRVKRIQQLILETV